jgi:hypothetical protein
VEKLIKKQLRKVVILYVKKDEYIARALARPVCEILRRVIHSVWKLRNPDSHFE